MNGTYYYTPKKQTNNLYILLFLLVIGFILISLPFLIVDYFHRVQIYNRYMCVEVYGLDENCKKPNAILMPYKEEIQEKPIIDGEI